MRLKRVEMQGFKSFADKTVLEFDDGITSVVGPNGSGKSNISDAVRWVLGEQSAKQIRGNKMEDVIFAGTQRRKPVGFAEVNIIIDNSEGRLPIEFAEVVVTRRVFRQSESEYLINNISCRLKDIHALFVDTGIGLNGYSIIGQGKIDEILSAKSDERRNVFEEAAGIMKYRVKKNEAERKLEHTEQNLLRLNDIINELSIQLGPLKEQSEKASQFLSLRDELRILDISLYISNLYRLKNRLISIDEEITLLSSNQTNEIAELKKVSEKNKEKIELSKKLENELNKCKEEYFSIESATDKLNSDITLKSEKISNLQNNIMRIDVEFEEADAQRKNIDSEEAERKTRLEYLKNQLSIYTEKLNIAQTKMDENLQAMEADAIETENLKEHLMNNIDSLSDFKVETSNIALKSETVIENLAGIDAQISSLIIENDKEQMNLEQIDDRIRDIRKNIEEATKIINEFEISFANTNDGLKEFEYEISKKSTLLESNKARLELLQDMEKKHEGFNHAVKTILNELDNNHEFGKGVHGVVARLISTESKYEKAIEAALGNITQNIVVDDEYDGKRVIEYLKSKNAGRATFLPLTTIRGNSPDTRLVEKASKIDGYIGIASDYVKTEKKYENIVSYSLGKVLLTTNLDSAIKIARETNHDIKCVTLDGDVINSGGSMSGGSLNNNGGGVFGRVREIQSLIEEITKDEKDIVILANKIDDHKTQIAVVYEKLNNCREEMQEKEHSRIKEESSRQNILDTVKRNVARIEELSAAKLLLENEKKELFTLSLELNSKCDAINELIAKLKFDIEKRTGIIKSKQSITDDLRIDITNYKVSIGSVEESINGISESMEKIDSAKSQYDEYVEKKNDEKENNKKQIIVLQAEIVADNDMMKKKDEEIKTKNVQIDNLSKQRETVEADLIGIIATTEEMNKNIQLLTERAGRVEVQKAKIESDIENMQERMWNDYEITYADALELSKDIELPTGATKRANEIRAEIKELGMINVAAIEDYTKTGERYEFMTKQMQDMVEAKAKLHQIIDDMVSVMKKIFVDQFKIINENFNEVFTELFDGGTAQISLSDENDILDCNIDIEAQLPGKKMQTLLLYSGGERALMAIALLLAILKLNPSPFYVFDEIEASLDDSNVIRFSEYIKKFSNDIQFVIITHRKGTMEVSDRLYGVTMEEKGISKILSLKL